MCEGWYIYYAFLLGLMFEYWSLWVLHMGGSVCVRFLWHSEGDKCGGLVLC